jgi:glycosyltransferase involved in cell wall biosynthesis
MLQSQRGGRTMMFVLSHPTGNAFVRATARTLHARGWLFSFHTTVVAPGARVLRLLPRALRRQIARRSFAEIPRQRLRTHPWRESVRLASEAIGLRQLTAPGALASVDAVYSSFDRAVARELEQLPQNTAVTGVYAYEDGAEHSFHAARARGLRCVYELPIAHWQTTQRLLHEEAERLPAWRCTLGGIDDSPAKLERKDRELAMADAVVVPSGFVLDSLPAHVRDAKPCIVAPFGAPDVKENESASMERSPGGPLRVLFAGSMTQRKGLADLFAAMRLLNRADVELVVMGSQVVPLAFYRQHYPAFVYEPPRPHAEVLALMRTCDVLALPAIVEGRALVQQEALASGLPLIVTRNAGGQELISEGRTGFLVPIRSPETLAERIAWFAERREQLPEMRREARRAAAETGWSHYEARVGIALSAPTEAARC